MKSAFVYRWRELATGKWYVGYHTGNPQDGYICSSKIVKPLIQSEPADWERKILRTGTTAEMIRLEKRILSKLQARTNSNSYNRSNGNGNDLGGRPFGLKNKNTLDYDLKNMSVQDTAELYVQALRKQDWNQVRKFDLWMIDKCVSKGTINKPIILSFAKYLHGKE